MDSEEIYKNCLKVLKDEAEDVINHVEDMILYSDIIGETLDEYNYKGKYFKIEYLPIIMSMALRKLYERLNESEEELDDEFEFPWYD